MSLVGHFPQIGTVPMLGHVRFAPKADKSADISLSPLSAKSGCEQLQQRRAYSITL
jgi:hypothetical protein